ncbi:MAG: RluA family pseudouridine synthase [Clostridia bacterium]|nr:RluA family pseudouridine synthase [Clostridia bacterium]
MQITVLPKFEGVLLRQLLRTELHLSSKMIKHLKFLPNGILVNGMHVTVRYVLRTGDVISLAIEDSEDAPIEPVDLPIEILYEDDDLVIPSKPANMPTHPSHDHHGDTVANALAYRYRESGKAFVFRPINRLDRNTSGLLLIARNRPTAGRLSEQMKKKQIEKTYLAILDGEMQTKEGVIDACLHRTAESIILREVCSPDAPDADAALTAYTVLASQNGHTLVKAHPLTGRTHQLRVHFASIGHPITGDDLYGTLSPDIPRHALHAYRLVFSHPTDGKRMDLHAPPAEDFLALLRLYFPTVEQERNLI